MAEIKKYVTRNTNALAEALGEPPWRTASRCYSMAAFGEIVRVSKGRPGRGGYPALWILSAKPKNNFPVPASEFAVSGDATKPSNTSKSCEDAAIDWLPSYGTRTAGDSFVEPREGTL